MEDYQAGGLPARRAQEEAVTGTVRYHVETIVGVHPISHENAQTPEGLKAELASWLESIGCECIAVTIRPADDDAPEAGVR